jgi:hypothetical protein
MFTFTGIPRRAEEQSELLLCPGIWWIAQSKCLRLSGFGLQQRFLGFSLPWFLRGRAKVDLDFFYLVSFDSEEFGFPGVAAILAFAVVEDEGFVAFFKQLLNAIGGGFLAIGPASFEIGLKVNAIVVWTGKYEVVGQKRLDGLAVVVFVGGEVLAEEVRVGHWVSPMVKNHGCKRL